MTNSRFELIRERARQLYPDRAGIALVEGLWPLARIALTARIARRSLRLDSFRVQSARETLESAISAVEHAAAGEPLTVEEDLAARDKAVLRASDIEKAQGNVAATAGSAARAAVRCLSGLMEFTYGENALLADLGLQSTIAAATRNKDADSIQIYKNEAAQAGQDDVKRLILYADERGEPWMDPGLDNGLERRDDRGWRRRLEAAGIEPVPNPAPPGAISDHWLHIHRAIRRNGGLFYPPDLFKPLG